jgi:hypothetical protein
MAMIIVVIPTTLFIITLLFDYWAAMQIDNRLKLMSHRAIVAINNAPDLSSPDTLKGSMKTGEFDLQQGLCPSAKPVLSLTRLGDGVAGQTQVETAVVYDGFNHLDPRILSSTIVSYSYNDQNGSFKLECK